MDAADGDRDRVFEREACAGFEDDPDGTILVEDPKLRLDARHEIEVRARRRGEPLSTDLSPVVFDTVIDTMDPVPSLETDGSLVRIGGSDFRKDAISV